MLFWKFLPFVLLSVQGLVFFLDFLLLFLELTLPLQEIELPLSFLLLRLNWLHLNFFELFRNKLLLFEFLEVLPFLDWFGFLGLGLQFLPESNILIIFFEIHMFQYLGDLWPILRINSQYLLNEFYLHRILIIPSLPNLLEKISGFFISVITSSPVSPRKGA